ncbi:pectinesterase inhibitor-like [Magnolia sinica]|uniref:pectinesterase inhibitor-like n=1 Tax=Magnolia sinica TaxID=86752 RepID=UPI002658846E|nr:pectinesterase inhibitor-like [Magnolia sinica]
MAPNSHYSLTFLLSLTLILQSSSSQLTQIAMDPIHEVCSQTAYDELCVACLESDPRSSTGDLNVFADILIGLALSNVTNTCPYISKLYNETAEPVLKNCLNLCLFVYEEAVYDLKDALTSLAAMDYSKLYHDMADTLDAAFTCDDCFTAPPFPTSPLTQQTLFLIQLSGITMIINDMLASSS